MKQLAITLLALLLTQDEPKVHPQIKDELKSLFEDTSLVLLDDTSGSTIAKVMREARRLRSEVDGQDDPASLMKITTLLTAEVVKFRHEARRRLKDGR